MRSNSLKSVAVRRRTASLKIEYQQIKPLGFFIFGFELCRQARNLMGKLYIGAGIQNVPCLPGRILLNQPAFWPHDKVVDVHRGDFTAKQLDCCLPQLGIGQVKFVGLGWIAAFVRCHLLASLKSSCPNHRSTQAAP
jgi:hypothetical protein